MDDADLSTDDVRRLEQILADGKTVAEVEFYDSNIRHQKPEVLRMLRALATRLTVVSNEARSPLMRIANVVVAQITLFAADDHDDTLCLFDQLAANPVLQLLRVDSIDMSRAVFDCKLPISDVLRDGVTLELDERAVESLALPSFLNRLLSTTRCNIIINMCTPLAKMITERALQLIGDDWAARIQVDDRIFEQDAYRGITESFLAFLYSRRN
jgi:hypothetical protein